MKTRSHFPLTLLCLGVALSAQTARGHLMVEAEFQEANGRVGWGSAPPHQENLVVQNAKWAYALEKNVAMLQAANKLDHAKAVGATRFAWPLRLAPGRPEFGAWAISNYIDHNPTQGQLSDYMCGARTYDNASSGHRGTDISSSGIPLVKLAQEAIHVTASAAGVIVVKLDGNPDVNCIGTSSESRDGVSVVANEITVQHADGMRTRYLHLKNDALTPKKVGDSVAEGEFLGILASSGLSSGPHLHFEVRGTANETIDPWAGTCNTTSQGLWQQQEAYKVPSILEVIPSASPPPRAANNRFETILGACANNVYTNQPESAYLTPKWFYKPGDSITMTGFLRDISRNDPVAFELTDPQGSPIQSGSLVHTGGDFSSQPFYFWTRTIPAAASPGQYALTFKFGGQAKSVPIYVGAAQPEQARVYDFYAASINHYFRVSNPGEASVVASGAAGDWKTTGDNLWMLPKGSTLAGAVDVCRFYGHPTIGPNSHFYTADAGECAALKTLQAQTPNDKPRWNYEETAFSTYLPKNGVCPNVAPVPVYRLYNNGFARNDSNHRLTSKWSVVETLKAAGWSLEANGNPVMCATGRPY
jgi:murein DD-endopeptidase MepM/ murein hydrolase activator NlpD